MISQSKIIDNIYSVAKKKGKLMKDLENVAGLSVGYLSRMRDNDNGPRLSVEVLLKICKELNIGVEALINYSNDNKTNVERKLDGFMNKLIDDTNNDLLKWDFYPIKDYQTSIRNRKIPLYRIKSGEIHYHYTSKFLNGTTLKSVEVRDGVLSAHMPNHNENIDVVIGSVIYYDHIHSAEVLGYELYFYDYSEEKPLCNSVDGKSSLFTTMDRLFKAGLESQNRIHIDKESHDLIDGYMNMDKPERLEPKRLVFRTR